MPKKEKHEDECAFYKGFCKSIDLISDIDRTDNNFLVLSLHSSINWKFKYCPFCGEKLEEI